MSRALATDTARGMHVRVIVTGSRDWARASSVNGALDNILRRYGRVTVVQGLCPTGADVFAHRWVEMRSATRNVSGVGFPANWNKEGRQAGFVRNEQMVQAGADMVLAFALPCRRRTKWCPPGLHASHGTADCVLRAKKAKIPVFFSPHGLKW